MSASLQQFADEESLWDHLEELNVLGEPVEVAAIDSAGVPFLATLTDTDECLRFVHLNSDGRAFMPYSCEACGAEGTDWQPQFPVVALVLGVQGDETAAEPAGNDCWPGHDR